MAQHDYILENQSGPSFRADLNGAMQAIATNNSGSTEPFPTYAYQFWADTTAGLWKQRNGANSAWITIGTLGATNLGLAPLASPAFTGVALFDHRWGEWHGGLKPAQISGQSRAVQLAEGLQTQPAVFVNDDLNLITFLQSSLTQAIGREPDRQAVAPAADRLLEVTAFRRRWL
jgi:hypothetical protein